MDVMSAFLHTGPTQRDGYVVPPRESRDGGSYLWLLLTAISWIVNANAKWQVLSEKILFDIALEPVAPIPLLSE